MAEHYEEYMAAAFTDEEYRGFLKGNIIKYIIRAGKKGSAYEDYLKAREYLNWLIQESKYDESDIPNKSLEQIMKEADEADAKKRQEAWIRLRDTRGWT